MSGSQRLLLLRPFYGITVHGDMHGDFGISDHQPHIYPDLSFIYSATIASQASEIDLHIIDANLDRWLPPQVVDQFHDDYDLIVLKTAGPTIQCDLDFAKEIKHMFPEARLVLAGHAASFIGSWINEQIPEVDEIIHGPMEDYVYRLVHGDEPFTIDDFPYPDFTLFNYERFRDVNGHLRVCLSTSRGCPVNCQYCPYSEFYGMKIEVRSLDKVMNDIEQLQKLGINGIVFRDQYFTFNQKRTEQLCQMMKDRGWNLSWSCETRLESATPELLDSMVDAGMNFISFGVESSAPIELKHYRRPPANEEKLTALVSHLHSRNVMTLAFYIVGFPGDHWNRVFKTYRFALRVGSKIAKFSIFEPCTHEMIKDRSITPALFVPFNNTMTINVCRSLTRKEIEFLVEEMTVIYHMEISKRENENNEENNYIKGVYDFHILPLIHFKELVHELQEKLKANNILELTLKKDARRKIRVY